MGTLLKLATSSLGNTAELKLDDRVAAKTTQPGDPVSTQPSATPSRSSLAGLEYKGLPNVIENQFKRTTLSA